MKRVIYILMLLAMISFMKSQTFTGHSQTLQFSKEQGFTPYYVNALVFDTYNWLWIAGSNLNSTAHQFEVKDLIIQRYNGFQFYNLPLPDATLRNYNNIQILNSKAANLLIAFHKKNSHRFFWVNPANLIFEEITDFPETISQANSLQVFPAKDGFILIVTLKNLSKIYSLTGRSNLKLIKTLSFQTGEKAFYNFLIEREDDIFLNDLRFGLMHFDKNWNFKELLKPEDLGLKVSDEKLVFKLDQYFILNNFLYGSFTESQKIFQFHPKTNFWKHDAIIPELTYKTILNFQEGNFCTLIKKDKAAEISCYKNDSLPIYNFNTPIPSDRIKMASRNIAKELIYTNAGNFYQYLFSGNLVHNFLDGVSIRSIVPYEQNQYLIGSVENGWFLLNLANYEIQPFEIFKNGKKYKADFNRGFIIQEPYIWSNDSNGIIKVNRKTHRVERNFIEYPISCMTNDDRYIYYGTDYHKLMKFDMNEERNIELAKTDSLGIMDIIKEGPYLLAATDKGVLEYMDGKVSIYQFDKSNQKDANFCISIDKDPILGILIGTKAGKVFQFSTANKRFKNIYSDSKQASITHTISLTQDEIWVNTFDGCVKNNLKTGKTIRYKEGAGLSNSECNRYSFLATKDHHFFVGTISGLNYLNPYNMDKEELPFEITLSTIGLYNAQNKKWAVETAPDQMSENDEIVLPPANRRLLIGLMFNGLRSVEDFSFYYNINNSGWIKMLKNEIDFPELQSGKHSIQFKASEATNEKTSNIIKLNVRVKAFFYQQTWFYICIIILLLLGIYLYYIQTRLRQNIQEQLSRGLINAQEDERSKIAMELHDDIGQKLSLLSRKSKSHNIPEIVDLADQSLNKLRAISHGLFPAEIEKLGLHEALIELIDSIDATVNMIFTHSIENLNEEISKDNQLHLYRIVQELITNIIKHSNATEVTISLYKWKKYIILKIRDNGVGFDLDKEMRTSTGIGMKSLHERVKIMYASIGIKSQKNKGTLITVKIKIK